MTTVTLYPARKKKVVRFTGFNRNFCYCKICRNREVKFGKMDICCMKVLSFAISDRISCIISVENNVIFMIYVCNVFKKIKKYCMWWSKMTFFLSVKPSFHVSLGLRPRETTPLGFYLEEKKYFFDHHINSYSHHHPNLLPTKGRFPP